MTEVSEKKIIEKVLGGDANAFEELAEVRKNGL